MSYDGTAATDRAAWCAQLKRAYRRFAEGPQVASRTEISNDPATRPRPSAGHPGKRGSISSGSAMSDAGIVGLQLSLPQASGDVRSSRDAVEPAVWNHSDVRP